MLLYYHLIDRRVLFRENGGFLSTAHTDEDIVRLIKAVKNSIEKLREAGFLSHPLVVTW